jgi:predicted porin
MNKLLPTALLLAVAGVAQAQVTFYGLIDMSYGKNNILDDALGRPRQKADFHSGGDDFSSQGNSTTRLGVKGSADIGSGVKGNFKFETAGITSDGDVGTGGQPFFNRQAWVGASGSFGEVRLGRQDSVPYQTMFDFDFNGAANAVTALGNSAVAPWLPGRQSRSLQYISNDFGGVTVQAGFVPEGNPTLPVGTTAKSVFSVGVQYAVGPLALAAAGQTKATSTGKNFASVAGSYDLKVVKLMASYANGGDVATGGSGKGIGLGVVAPVAGFNIGAHVAKNSDNAFKTTAVELFANREIFKNTYAYLDLGRTVNKTAPAPDVKANAYALGVIYVF